MDAFTISNVCKQYPGFSLQDITLALPQGAILGLVGENGAGKSTLIRLLLGAAKPDSGQIQVLYTSNQSTNFQKIKNDVGVVLDEAYFPEVLTARQLSRTMAYAFQRWDRNLYDEYLQRFSLPADKAFSTFSRGMRMKLAIAVALSHHPKLLVLDEATSGLDPMVREEILDLFMEFTREEDHSILLSSHIVSDLEKICDYIAFLHQGKLLLFAEKDRLLEDYALVHLPEERLAMLPEHAILGRRSGPYGVEVLMRRQEIPASVKPEYTTLEEIILFLAKGDAAK